MDTEYKGCHPGRECLHCPYPDCIKPAQHTGVHPTHAETQMRAAGNKLTVGKLPHEWLAQAPIGVHGWHRMN